jgi:chromosome segregation ATPase
MLAILVGIIFYVVEDAIHDRKDAMHALELQQQANLAQRVGTQRRIDLLNAEIEGLTEQVQRQAYVIGKQNQEITDLTAQLRRLGVLAGRTH